MNYRIVLPLHPLYFYPKIAGMKRFNCLVGTYIIVLFLSQQTEAQSYVPQWNNSKIKVKDVVPVNAYAFNLSDVRLLPNPFKQAMEADVAYLLKIDPADSNTLVCTYWGDDNRGRIHAILSATQNLLQKI